MPPITQTGIDNFCFATFKISKGTTVDFGRRVVQTARQTLIQKIKDIEKEGLYEKYKDLVATRCILEILLQARIFTTEKQL